jgi:hypothetical protein
MKITNKINGKFYYGSGQFDNYKGSGTALWNAYNKHGRENFEGEVLKYFETRSDAYLFEQRFMHIFDIKNHPKSYNMKNAGCGGDTLSSHPDKIEIHARAAEKRKGINNGMYGVSMYERLGFDDEKYEKYKKSCSRPGKQNGRHGKSLMSIWTEKYGLEEAIKREAERVRKRKENKLKKEE